MNNNQPMWKIPMNAEQFAYWLQGFAELTPTPPTQEQWDGIRDKLATVFIKPVVVSTSPDKSNPTSTHRDQSIMDAIKNDNRRRFGDRDTSKWPTLPLV